MRKRTLEELAKLDRAGADLTPEEAERLGAFLFLGLFLSLAAFFLLLHGGHNVGGNLKRTDKIEVKIRRKNGG